MLVSRRLARSGQLAAACAIACAFICASVIAVVVFAELLDQPGVDATQFTSGQQPPLVFAPPCGDQRARTLLAANVAREVRWRGGDNVLRWGEWRVVVGAARLPVRVLVAAVQAGEVSLQLASTTSPAQSAAVTQTVARDADWTIDEAPTSARLAAGASFATTPATSVPSFAQLMDRLPITAQLVSDRGAVDAHICGQREKRESPTRDRRLAIGTRADGSLLIVLAHFDGVGDASTTAPLGVSLPELASIMRALGAERAALLATGPSAQLMVRESTDGVARRWAGDVGSAHGLLIEEKRSTPRVNAGDLVSRP
jgi:hypothetical protein